jgi:hypothetical protein
MTKNSTNSSNSNQDISRLLLSLVCIMSLQNVDVSNRCRAWPLNKISTSYSLFCSNDEMKRKPYLILHKTKNYDRLTAVFKKTCTSCYANISLYTYPSEVVTHTA